jgi:hypothetical protein
MSVDNNIDITVNANLLANPVNIVQGKLSVGKPGVDFLSNGQSQFIQIPWKNLQEIIVEIEFGFYWRGIIVKSDSGSFEFVTAKTKKLVAEISKYLTPEQIKQRKEVMSR